VDPVVLTVVHDEAEAEIICGLLRANGIECSHRKTDFAAGSWTIGFASGGPIELLVHEKDLVAARELLPTT
jgi:Putative prokaryotic signal transducing protein